MSALATKAQSHKIFEKLKTKQANKACPLAYHRGVADLSLYIFASTVGKRIQHGHLCLLEYTSALTALPITGTSEFTSPLCDLQILTVRLPHQARNDSILIIDLEWQWDQLRIMK